MKHNFILIKVTLCLLLVSSISLIAQANTLWSWGDNEFGQLGDGTINGKIIPEQIGDQTDWKVILGGDFHTIAIKTDGTLWAWGDNEYGQIGDGTFINKNLPTQISLDNNWKEIFCGTSHNFAIKTDGTLWTWGLNDYGQLGLNDVISRNIPTQVGNDNKWFKISSGSGHTIGLKTDGTLWAWGDNDFGQLGDGSFILQLTPIQIGNDNNWTDISAGIFHSIGLKTDGTLWAWGDNDYWQLGINDNSKFFSVPTIVNQDNDWKSIYAGGYHNLALKTDGSLWAWGDNEYGQLGDGDVFESQIPKQIQNNDDWNFIGASVWNSFGIKSDGTLWIWGDNEFGQLGEASINWFVSSPIKINQDTDWSAVSLGEYHVLALKIQETEPDAYSLSGKITSIGNPLPNIEVSNGSFSVFTNQEGFYEFKDLVKDLYIVTPISNDYDFQPEFVEVNLNSNLDNINFIAVDNEERYSISGKILSGGLPIQGIEITNDLTTVITNQNGEYIFENLAENEYKITPVSNEYNFFPELIIIQLDGNISNANFEASLITDNIKRINNSEKLLLYPQPNNGLFTLKVNVNYGDELKIYDLTGILIHEKKFEINSLNHLIEIDLQSYSNGVYFLELINQNYILNQSLIINK